MKILTSNIGAEELTPHILHHMSMSKDITKMRDRIGEVIPVKHYMLYEDVNSKGETQRILSIDDGYTVSATNSPTFISDFERIVSLHDMCGSTLESVTVVAGVSKSGREYITCEA